MEEKNLCKCGCGKEAIQGNKFIKGHNRRGKVSFTSNGRWSIKYDQCRECGTKDRKHQRDGYCSACARRLVYSKKLKKKRDLTGGMWSKKHKQCLGCGTSERPHQAKGLCGRCWQESRNRKLGRPKRNFGGWSWYLDECKRCGSSRLPHEAKGLCRRCYDEVLREDKSLGRLKSCPVCEVRVLKLQQHISMKSKRCEKHKAIYDKIRVSVIDSFSSYNTSREIARKMCVDKRRILNIWHENFTTEEIKDRGEKIRVKKISGENNYLFGQSLHINKDRLFPVEDKQGRYYLMRSTWEVKYAQYLDEKGTDWEYEEHKFKYYDRDNTPYYYFPDFYLPGTGEFIEIKGYMDEKSKYKISECSKKYDIKIKVLQRYDLRKLGIDI